MKAGRWSFQGLRVLGLCLVCFPKMRHVCHVALALVALSWASGRVDTACGQANLEYDAAITLANGRLQRGNNAEAFTQALRAIDIDATRFEGHYFAALALLRQNHADRALSYARDALSRVTGANRKTVEELVEKVERGVRVDKLIEQAKSAEVAGNLFRAASDYAEAFDLDPAQANAGQAAVRIWLALKEPTQAARILRLSLIHI